MLIQNEAPAMYARRYGEQRFLGHTLNVGVKPPALASNTSHLVASDGRGLLFLGSTNNVHDVKRGNPLRPRSTCWVGITANVMVNTVYNVHRLTY